MCTFNNIRLPYQQLPRGIYFLQQHRCCDYHWSRNRTRSHHWSKRSLEFAPIRTEANIICILHFISIFSLLISNIFLLSQKKIKDESAYHHGLWHICCICMRCNSPCALPYFDDVSTLNTVFRFFSFSSYILINRTSFKYCLFRAQKA